MRWQELMITASRRARATAWPCATNPSRTGRKTSDASLPSNAASSVQYRGVWTDRNAPARLMSFSSRNVRDAIDLHVDALARRRGFHRRASRLHALEVLLEHAVEDGKVVHAPEEHADLHHIFDRGAAGFEDGADVVERDARLLGQVGRHHFLRRGIEWSLPGDEEKLSALDALGDGRLGTLGESGLGSGFRVHDLGFHA